MHFAATDVFDYYKPSKCARRVALVARGVEPEEAPDPFMDLLVDLGKRHEASHVEAFPGIVDLKARAPAAAERERLTLEEIRRGTPAIYQAAFRATVPLDGESCEVTGEPDFLLRTPGGETTDTNGAPAYLIRDSKLARNIDAPRHAGIPLQLQIYGFLYEHATGSPPAGLQVHAGSGAIVDLPYRGSDAVLEILRVHRGLRASDPGGYEPVGSTKCAGCGFSDRCWSEARAAGDVAILPELDQKLARELHARGVATLAQLDGSFDDASLRDLFWEKATKKKPARLKKSALTIRRNLDAHLANEPVLIAPPELPAPSDCVALDLEGLPAYADDLQKIYLWGLKDFSATPPTFLPSLAAIGPSGDHEAWQAFLRAAAALLAQRPNLRFVHWGTYETTALDRYAMLHGDPDGTAARVRERCLDLHPVFKASAALPVESYGLKSVGRYLGVARKLPDYDGGLAIARYIQAVETNDPALRAEILGEILDYNEEDLDGTWAVMEWLRNSFGQRRDWPC